MVFFLLVYIEHNFGNLPAFASGVLFKVFILEVGFMEKKGIELGHNLITYPNMISHKNFQ
jgi:hypothetical protein